MKKIIRLTESDLHRIIKEAVGYIYKRYDNTSPSPRTTVEDGIRKQTEKHRAESAKRRAERNNKKLETENTIISEVEGSTMGDGGGSGMSDPGSNGASNTANVLQGGGTKPRKGTYDTSAGGKNDFWKEANSRPLGNTTGIQSKAKYNVNM